MHEIARIYKNKIKLDALANERSTRTKHTRTHFTQAEI